MLSGYWQHACCYPRCLGSFSCLVGNVLSVLLAASLSLQYAALKGEYNAISCILSCYTIKSWFVMRAHALSNPSESKSAPHHSTHFVHGTEVIGSAAVLAREESNQIKSLLLSHHHSTSALVSEILESVLQTVQKNKNKIYI